VGPAGLRVVILGGGTAGWMTACLMARAWPAAAITLVEAPNIPIVGVGEGSTPQLRAFFRLLGLEEAEWMPPCAATYKAGIGFAGWSEVPGAERYFHPFASTLDVHTEPRFHYNALARRRGADVDAHPDRFFLNARLAAERRAPLPAETFPFDATYGYHFDAHLVGEVLRDHAVARGVTHRRAKVEHVAVSETGEIEYLALDDGEHLTADLFVDCSGFRSVIAQQALGVRFLPFAENLFNDAAVVLPTPPAPDGTDAQTLSTALSNGWSWRIPLRNRHGNGYVYASRYCSADEAETELRTHLGLLDDPTPARHLTMKVGRVETSWTGNCLAVGLSQGFVEPLEATALHVVQATVEGFVRAFEQGGFTPAHRDAFNAEITRRIEGIRDYLVAHYRLNRRTATDYWRDNAGHDRLSESLKALMTCWFTGGDLVAEIDRQGIADIYSPASWTCLFAGYGIFPDAARLRAAPDAVDLPQLDDFLRRSAWNFPDHRAALEAQANR
jgi:2-polyprenyl-6-methoxyphenol hydroxylase-like FAD-dependent oxidoreductase